MNASEDPAEDTGAVGPIQGAKMRTSTGSTVAPQPAGLRMEGTKSSTG